MNKLQQRLELEKEELLVEIKSISRDDNGKFVAKETTTNNDDVSDFGDISIEQSNLANNQAILSELQARLDNVDSALTRIESGVYGECEDCKKEISEERLLVNPAASLCIDCEKKK